MSELRWVLLLLGVLLIGLIWALGSGRLRRLTGRMRSAPGDGHRREPTVEDSAVGVEDASDPDTSAPTDAVAEPLDDAAPDRIDRVITVRFVPRSEPMPADKTVLALRAAGLRHGQYGIFHMFRDETSRESLFSVANLTEPGSFDLTNLTDSTIPGMNFFLVLPGPGDPVERFDQMVDTARELARSLDAELRDERGSSWSIQRERYVREEVIEYRHQTEGHPLS
jgi:cell division protein ZipA